MKDLTGSNAIVTGASRGLGVTVAKALAQRGVNLALAARSADDLESARAEMVGLGVKAIAVPTDVSDAASRRELVERAEAELGPVDLLVNNAGIEVAAKFESADPDQIAQVIDVNLAAPLLLTRELVPRLLERGRGHVVNMASLAGKAGTPYEVAYSASKFGLVGATLALRAEYIDSPIGFSVVCPGFVTDDGMYARIEDGGVSAPRIIGTTTPDAVARGVVRAIEQDRPEVLVNTPPMRPLIALMATFPRINERVMATLGVKRFFGRVVEEGLGGSR